MHCERMRGFRVAVMDPFAVINKYYVSGSRAYHFLTEHGRMVAGKAEQIARRVGYLNPDVKFIREAALLHDIGILFTTQSGIGCFGDKPYVCHGYLGRELLESEGLPVHALVCERHVGAGITRKEIEENGLPVPHRDMIPVSIEEQIICYADKFFSKDTESLHQAKPLERVRRVISLYGEEQLHRFNEWVRLFET